MFNFPNLIKIGNNSTIFKIQDMGNPESEVFFICAHIYYLNSNILHYLESIVYGNSRST
jgi:hypothetical protein